MRLSKKREGDVLLMVPSSFILQPTMRSAWRRPMKKD
jgi:hypothetical protein